MSDKTGATDSVPHLQTYAEVQQLFQGSELPNPKGPSSLLTRQLILHLYSPKVSVISSELADQVSLQYQFGNFLEFMQCFEDSIYGPFSFLNNRVHVKFNKPIDELLRIQMDLKNDRRNNLNSELFDVNTLKPTNVDTLNYMKLINQISSSLTILPFETLNHPILQLIVISLQDSIQTIKTLINDWKYLNYPNWIDLTSMFLMFLIVVDTHKEETLEQAVKLQEHLKLQMNYRSLIVIRPDEEKTMVNLRPPLGSESNSVEIGAKFKQTMNSMIVDLINKYLVPFMEKKMLHWTETLVNPRKSFTGRLFSVGKRWGSGGTSQDANSGSTLNYNSLEHHYYVNSNEFLIRRLGDWYFMLKDYKKSYTTYELLKKDFLNDKSWDYLASLQEFMILSLLVGSSQKVSMIGSGITVKIMHDLITPMIDSLQYSYLSRCYLRTYTLRSIMTIAEFFILLSESNQSLKVSNNNNMYFDQSYQLFSKLIDLNLIEEPTKAIVMKRVSYIYDIYYLDLRTPPTSTPPIEDYKKIYTRDDFEIIGMTRHRKSALWEYMAQRKQEETGMVSSHI